MTTSPTRGSYWPTVLLAIMALCLGQINFTALDLLNPTIAQNLGVSPTDASWVSLLGNAALPLGYLVSADLTRRLAARRLVLGALILFVVSSLGCALAQNLPALIAAYIAQSFASGLLSLAIIVPLLTGFPPRRMPMSITVLVLGLFGASTLGPVVGGLVEQTGTWRLLFAVNALLGLVIMPLAWATVPEQPAPNPHARMDGVALLLAFIGVLLIFIGIGQLPWHNWGTPQVAVPVVLGAVVLVALFAVEWMQSDPLLTVRSLWRPRPVGATVLSCVAAIGYGGMFSLLPQFLEQVRGLGAQDAGGLLWPTFVGAVVGAGLAGAIFTKARWVSVLALGGLLLLAVAAWLLTRLTAFTGDGSIMQTAAILGLGASISLVPALLVAALTAPVQVVGRALAFLTLLRFTLQASAGPVLTHFIETRRTIHFAHLAEQRGFNLLASTHSGQAGVQGQAVKTSIQVLMNHGLVLGMNDAAALLLLILVLGAALAVLILLME